MKYLITATLLNSFYWFYEFSDIAGRKEEFQNFLNKKPFERNAAMQAGIDFENDVRGYTETGIIDYACKKSDLYNCCVVEVGDIVKPCTWQVSGSKNIHISDKEICLYGITDAIDGPIIYDIKYVKTFDYGKYQKSIQHSIYMHIFDQSTEFVYLVSDGKSVYTESYRKDQVKNVVPTILDFFSWLSVNPEYEDFYFKNWEAKY